MSIKYMKDIKKITLEEAYELYFNTGMGFILRDGMLKGFIRELN